MKRICFVSTNEWAGWGGSEELWSRAAAELIGKGHAVEVFVRHWPEMPPALTRLAEAGAIVHRRLRLDDSLRSRLCGLAGGLFRPVGLASVCRRLRKIRPSLIVISSGSQTEGLELMQFCREEGVPYACVIQCALDYLWPADSKTGSLAESFRRARRVWFVSRKNHELVEKQLGADIPADWIGNPIRSRPEVLPPWPAAPPFKMALVGRLEPLSKGQDLLFEALRSEKWKRRPLEISLFGEGRCRESLEALRRRWGLERVRFSGFEEDLESIWRAHHALVLPSRHEGLPLAVLEAAWFGRLSVVTDAGDCAELVRDGETGFVARGPSARDLDEALERAWARRTEWRAMGERARLEIRDRFTPDPSSVFAGAVERLAGAELC